MLVDNKGFTLIELLVVIAVLGILAAIAIPRLGGVTDKARNAEFESVGGTIRLAMEMFRTEYGDHPDDADINETTAPTTYDELDDLLDTVELPNLNGLTRDSTDDFSYALDTASNEFEITLENKLTSTTFTITEDNVGISE